MRRSLRYILATQWRRSVVEKSGTEWTAVFVCLLVGTFIWLVMALSKPYSYTISMPVSFDYDQTAFQPVRELPKRIKLNVSGLGWRLLIHQLGISKSGLVLRPQKNKPADLGITEKYLYQEVSQQYPDLKVSYIISEPLLISFEPILEYQLPIAIDDQDLIVADTIVRTTEWAIHPATVMVKTIPTVWASVDKPLQVRLPRKRITKDHEEVIPLETKSFKQVQFMQQEVLVSARFGQLASKLLFVNLKESELPISFSKFKQPIARITVSSDNRFIDLITPDSFNVQLGTTNGRLVARVQRYPICAMSFTYSLMPIPKYKVDTSSTLYKCLK